MARETYDFLLDIKATTAKAVLATDGMMDYWLPKSQIFSPDVEVSEIQEGDQIRIFLEEWLAKDKGII